MAPACAAIGAALELSRERLSPRDQLLVGAWAGVLAAVAAFASALLHGLRVGYCGVGGSVSFFVLTAGAGAVLGGVWGGFVAEGARRAKRRTLHAVSFALSAPLLAIAISVARFYRSPIIFAFDPFVGYFSGTLYDTVVDTGAALWTYRAGSAATFGAAVFAASLFAREDSGALRFDRGGSFFVARAVGAAALFGISVTITLAGPALGHWQTPATIAAELGARSSGPRCDVIHGDEIPPDGRTLLVRDCEEQLAGVEKALGAQGPARITAYIFRDKNEKKRLMGAGDTYIAKPWRNEVYLQSAPYPHPVLAHELAHVVAGAFGEGPFRIAGKYGGLLPDPGLIEGIAVAAAPEHDILSDDEWSRAMLDLDILPKLGSIFSLGFLGQSSSKSYTVAGAAVKWLMETRGRDKVRALYSGQSPEAVLGASWTALDGEFRTYLRTLSLSPDALAYAKARFDRPSVFGRKCPHEVDALVQEAVACRDGMRFERALFLYGEALEKNDHEMPAMLGRAVTRLRMGDLGTARAEIETLLKNDKTPKTTRDRAEEALADALFREQKYNAASDAYRTLAARVLDEDFGRTLEVKALLAADPLGRAPLEGLLLGLPGRATDMAIGLARVEAWRAATQDPLADYLLGRNLAGKSNVEALAALRRAVKGPLPTARVRREAARQLAVAACVAQDRSALDEAAAATKRELAAGATRGFYDDVTRQLEQCAPR